LNDIEGYLNREDVRNELGVDKSYKSCNMDVNKAFALQGDIMKPYHMTLQGLLDNGISVLIYAGKYPLFLSLFFYYIILIFIF